MFRLARAFHASCMLQHRWVASEDALLLEKYKELGPAWTLLSLSIRSRSPTECRRRYLTISGKLEGLSPAEHKLVYEDGYEMHNGLLIKIPQERIVSSPFARLAAAIPPVRFRSLRRRQGWTPMEIMAVQEGFEQYGPRWDVIARRLQYRTDRQCRNMMQRRFITWSNRLLCRQYEQGILPPLGAEPRQSNEN